MNNQIMEGMSCRKFAKLVRQDANLNLFSPRESGDLGSAVFTAVSSAL